MIYADQCTIFCASASFMSGIQNPFATPSQASRYPRPVVSGEACACRGALLRND